MDLSCFKRITRIGFHPYLRHSRKIGQITQKEFHFNFFFKSPKLEQPFFFAIFCINFTWNIVVQPPYFKVGNYFCQNHLSSMMCKLLRPFILSIVEMYRTSRGHFLSFSTTYHSQHRISFLCKLCHHKNHAQSLELRHIFSIVFIRIFPTHTIHTFKKKKVAFNFEVIE